MSRIAPIATTVMLLATLVGPEARPASACTCRPNPGIEHVYAGATHVVRVNIRQEVRHVRRLRGLPPMDGDLRAYRARVKQSYKGCLRRGRIIKLVTAKNSGLCGATLDRRQEYVLALGDGGDRNVFEVNLCDFLRPTSSLSPEERTFLDSRVQCCKDRCDCTDSEPTSCLVDPCSVESCGDAVCTANFCGGCHAEFHSEAGIPVCTACTTHFDCPSDQSCELGRCLPTLECVTDDDCSSGAWCRDTPSGGSACAPFVGEGASCGGFLAPWSRNRCAPGLDCAPPPPDPETPITPDLPGTCEPNEP